MSPMYLAAAALACSVLASACSKKEDDKAVAANSTAPSPVADAKAKQAILKRAMPTYPRVEMTTDAGLFWFEPRRCNIGPDPGTGLTHFSIEGAGQSPDGLAIYFTLEDEDSDPNNSPEIRINVGTDQAMKTPEVVWISNDGTKAALKVAATRVSIDQQRLTLAGVVFSRDGSSRMTVQAPILIDCGLAK